MTYLKTLSIEYDPDDWIRHGEPLKTSKKYTQTFDHRRISQVIDRMKILLIFFDYALREAKIEMKDPAVTTVWIGLSRNPKSELNVSKKNLGIDLDCDPADLTDIPKTAEALGEFALECWEKAIERLEVETDFPAAFVREQMDKFRAQGYAMGNSLKPAKIKGSKATARIHGKISCARTELFVEVSYRKHVLFERKIWDTPEQAFNIAYTRRDFVVEDGCFKVREAVLGLLPEAVFPLDSLPDDFALTLVER
ncbi:hypothetical protein [Pseudaestuariivita rosea]|uniref:hypothetical protein n=1 Tax=Pseudaestuariivita rosea TaxID=2763263 RepID=UPI001ABA0DCB|nr:hypothetical protein [Pseudaestuariivita rosea]